MSDDQNISTTLSDERPPRVWRGVPRADRVQERRTRMLEAGLEVFGTVGVRQATVSSICDAAQLTQRYLYESFPSVQALLIGVFERVCAAQREQMILVARQHREQGADAHGVARRALLEYFQGLRDDPRTARVQLLETLGVNQQTNRAYQEAIEQAAQLLLRLGVADHQMQPVSRLAAVGAVGATTGLATTWLLGDYQETVDDVADSALLSFAPVTGGPRGS